MLVAPPVMLLGAASPYAIRLAVERVEESGTVAGRMYAISTIGSLVGTWTSALLLVPLIGTRRTFLVFGLACAVVALTGVRAARGDRRARRRSSRCWRSRWGRSRRPATGIVLDEVETQYQYARVVEEPDGERKLELNEGQAIHSLYRPGSYLTGDYWDEFLVLPFAARRGRPARWRSSATPPARRRARSAATSRTRGRRGRDRFGADDARAPLVRPAQPPHARAPRGRAAVPAPHAMRATTRSWSTSTASPTSRSISPRASSSSWRATSLNPGGVGDRERRPSRRARTSSSRCCRRHDGRRLSRRSLRDPSEDTNTHGPRHELSRVSAALPAQRPALPAELRRDGAAARPLASRPRLDGGTVYTDDKAPVEWLVDKSIVEYAADGE